MGNRPSKNIHLESFIAYIRSTEKCTFHRSEQRMAHHCRRHYHRRRSEEINHQTQALSTLLNKFDLMLQCRGISREEFIRNLQESPNPKETFQIFLDDFEIFSLQNSTSSFPTLEDFDDDNHAENNNNNNENTNATAPPASWKAIQCLPEFKLASFVEKDECRCGKTLQSPALPLESCGVCCEIYSEENDVLKQLPCGHSFHVGCIDSWLQRHCTCPLCRYEIETDNMMFELGRKNRMKLREPVVA